MERRIIDVREYPEYAAAHIENTQLVPLGTLDRASENWNRTAPLDLLCRSGRRAQQAKELLERKGFRDVRVMEGGIEAWQKAGRPVVDSPAKPWSMERQVRVAAGALVFVFVTLGALASRKFYVGAGLVGFGLVFSGVSDTCMMASVLGRMPWNQAKQARA